jgi:hypothetical protein
MIDERELSTLLDLTEPAEAPPLGQVVHRGRRLRRRRQLSKAASVVAVAVLLVGVARALPAPTREIRTASVPGGDAPAPDFGDTGIAPAPGTDHAAEPDGSGAVTPPVPGHDEAGAGGDSKRPTPTTVTTAPPTPDHRPETHDGQPVTTPTTTPNPHSTVPTTNGKLTGLSAAGLSPAFNADTKYYTAPADHDVITVTATLADPGANLYIQSNKVESGVPFRAWVGEGQAVDVVIYSDWTEIGRYTITRAG